MTHIRYSSSDEMRSIMKKYITLLEQLNDPGRAMCPKTKYF